LCWQHKQVKQPQKYEITGSEPTAFQSQEKIQKKVKIGA
jgi:hypothetical protein